MNPRRHRHPVALPPSAAGRATIKIGRRALLQSVAGGLATVAQPAVRLQAAQPAAAGSPAPVRDIGDRKQLFIDRRFIERGDGIDLVMNPPRDRQVVLESVAPWESMFVMFTSVIDTGAGYKMYYTALVWEKDGRAYQNLCLVESDDGVSWRRPELGLFEFEGSTKNNIVGPNLECAPHHDPRCPLGEPYMMLASVGSFGLSPQAFDPSWRPDGTKKLARVRDPHFGMFQDEPFLMTSPDGVRWRRITGPLLGLSSDNWNNQLFYDESRGTFVAYLRGAAHGRTVHRYETDDPRRAPWAIPRATAVPGRFGEVYLKDELPIVIDKDAEDRWPGDVQNQNIVIYPWAQDAYLAFTGLYRHYPGPMKARPDDGARHRFRFLNDGPNDIHLFVSRDGVEFSRPSRWPYLDLGIYGDDDGGSAYAGAGMVRAGNEIWQYFTVSREPHGSIGPGTRNLYKIIRTRHRLDGFVSADAGHRGGELVTPPMTFTGDRLELNIDCGALGETWVEIQDEAGNPLPGRRLDECDPVDLNHVRTVVTWRNKPDVGDLQGRPVRLRFKMRLSKLFAFQFVSGDRAG